MNKLKFVSSAENCSDIASNNHINITFGMTSKNDQLDETMHPNEVYGDF